MENLLRPKDLSERLSISIPTLYRRMKEPDFPKKVRISSQAIGFKESEVLAWIESQKEESEA